MRPIHWILSAAVVIAPVGVPDAAAASIPQRAHRKTGIRRLGLQLGPPSSISSPTVWTASPEHVALLKKLPPAFLASTMKHRLAIGAHPDAIGVAAGGNLRADRQPGVIVNTRGNARWGSNLAHHDGVDLFWAGSPGTLVNPFPTAMRVRFIGRHGDFRNYYGRVQLLAVGADAPALDLSHAELPTGVSDGAIIAPGAVFARGTDTAVVPGYTHIHVQDAPAGIIAGVKPEWFGN